MRRTRSNDNGDADPIAAADPTDHDMILTKLFNAVIEIIRENTKCDTAQGITQKFKMAMDFITDIPLGKIFEPKYIDHILKAWSVITFPYKQLMCGNTNSIIQFYQSLPPDIRDIHFIAVDLENMRGDTIMVSLDGIDQHSHLILVYLTVLRYSRKCHICFMMMIHFLVVMVFQAIICVQLVQFIFQHI